MTTAETTQPRVSLWRHRDFMLLWSGQTIGEVGSQVAPFAIPFFAVTALHASNFQVGVLQALSTLAFLLVALPAGVVVDRMARHRLMMWCDLLRALVIGSVPLVWYVGNLTMVQLYLVVLVAGVLTVFFDVAYQSYVPVLLDKDALMDGNGKLGTTSSLAYTVGPSVAGGLVGLVGAARAVMTDGVSFLVSALSLSLIRTPEPKPEPASGPRPRFRQEIAEGLGFVVRHPILRKVVACTGTCNLFGSMMVAVEVPFLIRTLHLSAGKAGLLLALPGIGGILGGMFAGRLARAIGSARIIWFSILVTNMPMLVMPLAYPGWRVLFYAIGGFFFGAGTVVYSTAQVSYRQAICPPELLGRMNAAVRWIVWGTMPIGALIGGGLATAFSIRTTLWIGVIGAMFAGLLVLFSPLRTMRDIES